MEQLAETEVRMMETGETVKLSEDDLAARRRRVSILCLIGAHLALGLALGTFLRLGNYSGQASLPLTFFAGLLFAQASLLGIWGSLGAGPWWIRLVGIVAGSVCLATGAAIGIGERDLGTIVIFTFTTFSVAVVYIIFRCFRFRIGSPRNEGTARAELQFGIRHLLIVTVVVAVMLAVSRSLEFNLSDYGQLPLAIIFASPYALVGMLSPWAILRGRLLIVRAVILLAIAATAGWGLAQMIKAIDAMKFWMGISLTEAVLLIASLIVVRSCGYRLMRRRKLQVEHEPTEADELGQPHP